MKKNFSINSINKIFYNHSNHDYIDQLITYQQISTEYKRLTDQLIIKLHQ